MDERDMLECDGEPMMGVSGACRLCRYASETTGGLHKSSGTFEILFECLADREDQCPFYDEREEDDG